MPTRRYLTRLGVAPEGLLRRRVSPGRAERIGLMAILVLATAIPIPVLAQGVVVQGRVFQFGSTSGIANATVDLEGHGSTLTSAAQLGHVLDTTLPQEVELIEFLFFDRLLMLRIYTREFMQEMFDRSIELRAPTLAPLSRPPVCL